MVLVSCSSRHTAVRVRPVVVCTLAPPILAEVLGSLYLGYPTHLIHIAGNRLLPVGCLQFLASVNMITKKVFNIITCVLLYMIGISTSFVKCN